MFVNGRPIDGIRYTEVKRVRTPVRYLMHKGLRLLKVAGPAFVVAFIVVATILGVVLVVLPTFAIYAQYCFQNC